MARYYDPSMGRFLNEDTVEGQIDNPLSQNLYTYVGNNPLIYSDPTGHESAMITLGKDPYDYEGKSGGQVFCEWWGCEQFVQDFLNYPGEAWTINSVKNIPDLVEEAPYVWA